MMAEKIKIVELDIDTATIEQKAVKTQQQIDNLKERIASLKKEQKLSQLQAQQYANSLKQLQQQGQGNSTQAQYLEQVIAKNTQSQHEQTLALIQQTAQLKRTQADYNTYSKILQATSQSQLVVDKIITTTNGSIKELSSALSHNKQLYQSLSKEQRDNAQIGGKLLKVIQEQDKQYKDLHTSIGNTQVQVGNYKEEIKKALAQTYGLDSNLSALTGRFGAFQGVVLQSVSAVKSFVVGNQNIVQATQGASQSTALLIKGVYGTSTALKVLRGAVVSTGIGALIVALGSLVAYFSSTQEGADKLNAILTPLKEVFASLLGVVQKVGQGFFNTFAPIGSILKDIGAMVVNYLILPFKQVGAVFGSLSKAISGDFKGAWDTLKKPVSDFTQSTKQSFTTIKGHTQELKNGVKDIAKAFQGAGQDLKNAFSRGEDIAKTEKKLSEFNIHFQREVSELKALYSEQLKIIEDTSLTQEQRLIASKQAKQTQEQINALYKEQAQLELHLMDLKTQANDTSREELQAIEDRKSALKDQQRERTNQERELQKKMQSIKKQAHEQWIQTQKKLLEQEKQHIDNYLKEHSATAQSLQERIALEEHAKNKRLDLLKQEHQKGLISTEQYNQKRKDIEMDFAKEKAEISIQALNKEVEIFIKTNTSKIQHNQRLNDTLLAQENQRLDAIYQSQLQALEKEKELKIQAQQWDFEQEKTLELKKIELKDEFTQAKNDLQQKQQEQKQQEQQSLKELENANRILSLQEQGTNEFAIEKEFLAQRQEAKLEHLKQQHQQGLISTEQFLKEKELIVRASAQIEKDIDKKLLETKIGAMQSALSTAKSVFGEHTAIGKASAVAEATINTYLGVTKALTLPPPMSFITAGVTLATGLQNVSKIVSTQTPKKFAHGGLVKGRSHAQGGVPFSVQGEQGYEMEGGEFIVNKKATKLFLPQLQAINNFVNYNTPTPFGYFQNGGVVQKTILAHSQQEMQSAKIQVELNAQEIAKAVEIGAKHGTEYGTTASIEQVGWENIIKHKNTF